MIFKVSIVAASMAFAGSAHAQTLQLGNTDQIVGGALKRAGYEPFRVVKRDFRNTFTHACRDGRKFLIRVNLLGRLDIERNLGRCDLVPAADRRADRREDRRQERREARLSKLRREAQARLRDEGFTEIVFEEDDRLPFTAEACRATGERVQLEVSRRGRVRDERRIGRCQPKFARKDIVPVLKERGFDRIEVKRARAPYIAHVCRKDRRIELVLDRAGEVVDRRRLGECQRPIASGALEARLLRNGWRA